MTAKDKRGTLLRLLALGVPSTAVLLFTSFLTVPPILRGPLPADIAAEVAGLSEAETGIDVDGDLATAGTEAELLLLRSYGADLEAAEGAGGRAPVVAATTGAAAGGSGASGGSVAARSAGLPAASVAGSSVSAAGAEAAASRTVSFLDRQLAFPRVARAFESKSQRVASLFHAKEIARPAQLFVRVFKREQELEVWARPLGGTRFVHLTTYPVCKISGRLGPKRRQGDRQIPEGFYTIDGFNPRSSYHLSMHVNYPNAVDAARGRGHGLGGDIFVHGGCVTIGCVPITDSYIEELYVMAVEARSAGQRRIPIHIFPTRMDSAGMAYLRKSYGGDFVDFPFWKDLERGYSAFEKTRMLPRIRHDGPRYTVIPPAVTPAGQPPS